MAKRRPWDKERIEKFLDMYPSSKWEVLEKEFACSRATLTHKACELGIRRQNINSSLYSDNEDQILYKYHLTHTAKEISEVFLPHRTPASVEARMSKLGIGLRRRIQWNQENVDLLQVLYPIYSPAQVAEIMGTTYDAVINAARKFHVKSSINRKYSEQELSFIQDACKTMDDKEIGKILMRSAGSIKEIRRTHGWKRPANNITKYNDLYHYLRRSNVCWKKKSQAQCNGLCVISRKPSEAIHHLYGMHMIVDELIQQEGIDIGNFEIDTIQQCERKQLFLKFKILQEKYPLGVCLTKDIHLEFHSQYGYGNNTPDQFLEFVQCSYPKALDNIVPFIKQ